LVDNFPAMAKLVFNDVNLRKLTPASGRHRIDYAVNDIRGFAVQTTYTGSKRFLLVYTAKATGAKRRLVIGPYGPAPKLSLSAGREQAKKLRAIVELGGDPWLEASNRRAAAEAKRVESRATFGDLMNAYVELLRRARKPSANGVAREIRSSIQSPFQRLWKTPAIDISLDDLVPVLRRLTRASKWRQAEKTRSYIRAAYTAAAAARGKADASDLFAEFAKLSNIGRDLATIDRPKDVEDATSKRALTSPELAAYWRRIEAKEGVDGALLRAHLLTGAQRCTQLSRLAWRSVEDGAITLLDGKGRRKKLRQHVVPLLDAAAEAFRALRGAEGEFAFSLDGGKTGAGFHALRRKVAEVTEAMVEAGEVDRPFTPGELRITVETRLAAAGVPMEVRAQLQSHGLGGVQNKHYDKHDYFQEKRAALETLLIILEGDANVVPFRSKFLAA
jgi:hypothetical protein